MGSHLASLRRAHSHLGRFPTKAMWAHSRQTSSRNIFLEWKPRILQNYKGYKRQEGPWTEELFPTEVWRDTITKYNVWSWTEHWTRKKKKESLLEQFAKFEVGVGLRWMVVMFISWFVWLFGDHMGVCFIEWGRHCITTLLLTGSEKG